MVIGTGRPNDPHQLIIPDDLFDAQPPSIPLAKSLRALGERILLAASSISALASTHQNL